MSCRLDLAQSKTILRNRLYRHSADAIRPLPKLLPSEWAEANIRIPLGNAIPGLIRFDNAPYQREPLDMISRADCERITLMWGAQTGKTNVFNCAIGFNIDQRPRSMMVMQPSQGDLKTWLETKLNPMIEGNDNLSGRVAKPRAREGVNNQQMKSYPGGYLMFAWAGSPKTMRGRSAPVVICDEIDGYEATPEGDPVSLLWQRAATFGDQRLLIESSTPTIKGASRVENSYEQSDQRRYYIPCPHCEEYQTLKWSNVSWSKNEQGEHLPETAIYACEHCGGVINDGQKVAALRKGEWRAAKPWRGHAGYHLNELYSAFRKFRDIVKSFLEKKEANDLQTFVNVSLAETWEEQGDQVEASPLFARREDYGAELADGCLVLTAGIDVQDDRLEIGVEAWGERDENWKIDYQIISGDPAAIETWQKLDQALLRRYAFKNGTSIGIAAAFIDSGGHFTQKVYDYVRPLESRRIFASKGMGGEGVPIVSRPSRSNLGKVPLYMIGASTGKELMFASLAVNRPGAGYVHFPHKPFFDLEYFEQLTAEKRVTRYVKGQPKREWVKRRARNEALDIAVLNIGARILLNPDYEAIKKSLGLLDEPEVVEEAPPIDEGVIDLTSDELTVVTPKPKPRQRRDRGFANAWR